MRLDLLLEALPIAGVGFAGVFLVTGVLRLSKRGAAAVSANNFQCAICYCLCADFFRHIQAYCESWQRMGRIRCQLSHLTDIDRRAFPSRAAEWVPPKHHTRKLSADFMPESFWSGYRYTSAMRNIFRYGA